MESPSTYRFGEGHQTAEAEPTLLRVYNETGVMGSPRTRPSAQCSWPGLRRNLWLTLPRGPYGRREEERCSGLQWLGFSLLCKAGKEVRLLQGLLMRSREKQIGTHPLPPHWHRLNLNPSPEFFGKLGALRQVPTAAPSSEEHHASNWYHRPFFPVKSYIETQQLQ